MASKIMVIQYSCGGLLRFIVTDDMTVDMEIMTLKVYIFLSKIRIPLKKPLPPGVRIISLLHHF